MTKDEMIKLASELEHDMAIVEDLIKSYEDERLALERLKIEEEELHRALNQEDIDLFNALLASYSKS